LITKVDNKVSYGLSHRRLVEKGKKKKKKKKEKTREATKATKV
jgi:hypothetical protein